MEKERYNEKHEKLKQLLLKNGKYNSLSELAELFNYDKSMASALSNYNRRGVSKEHIRHLEAHFANDGFLETDLQTIYKNITGEVVETKGSEWRKYNTATGQIELLYKMLQQQQETNRLLKELISQS